MAAITGSCPGVGGGTFYVCQNSTIQFVGCCSIDPCADGTGNCPSTDLGYTTFDADSYGAIPPQDCVSTGLWYTCMAVFPPFMGCCTTNPCQNDGCYGSNLTAAALSSNASLAAPFTTATAESSDDDNSVSVGTIVGVAIGSAMAALILAIIAYTLYRRRQRRNRQAHEASTVVQPDPNASPGTYMPSPYQDSSGFPSPPPHYGAFGPDKLNAYPHSPGQIHHEQRSTSVAPSWHTGTTSSHGYGHHSNPSISSMGSSQGGLHFMYNQQRPQQHLNAVSEMDNTQVVRSMSELPGSFAMGQQGDVYEMGYTRVPAADNRR